MSGDYSIQAESTALFYIFLVNIRNRLSNNYCSYFIFIYYNYIECCKI